jgi:hypothetical protein
MSMKISKSMVVVLTVTVALVFVAPLVNLEPTALRSVKAALALFVALTSLSLAQFIPLHLFLHRQQLTEDFSFVRSSQSVLDLICSRLC